ncbi:hypothetical protein BGZ72_007490 [Mortierella alpina]|nr:hypothetical protein BGZ72_007490 [Mortierella alpina]
MIELASQLAQAPDGHVHLQKLNSNMVCAVKLQAVDTKLKVFVDKQEELIQLQKQTLAQQEELKQQLLLTHSLSELAVLRNRIQGVLSQTSEPHGPSVPRLFVVLPDCPSVWNAADPICNKFRLYFMCDCGEHTRPVDSNTEIPHHIHITQHEGYEIAQPSEFFRQWGTYVLAILKMLKYGVSVAGMTVPDSSNLVIEGSINKKSLCPKALEVELGVDLVIECLDNLFVEDSEGIEGVSGKLDNKEVLDGLDMQKLDALLEGTDGCKVLGNLHRILTDEGHIKWVCLDHYNERYPKEILKKLQLVLESASGSLAKDNSVVKVKLASTARAKEFYNVLMAARFVLELDIALDWACTASDIQALEDALKNSRVSVLRLDLRRTILGNDFLSKFAVHGVILRVEELPCMKMIHIVLSPQLTSAQRRMNYISEGK